MRKVPTNSAIISRRSLGLVTFDETSPPDCLSAMVDASDDVLGNEC